MSRLLPFQSDADVPEDRSPRVVDLDGEDAERVFGALSSETAREIFQSLHDEPMTASDIAEAVDSSIQNVRYHVEKLEDAGLVEVVDTWYSSRGNEMKVYAPKDGPLIVSSDETRASRIRTALGRLVGGVGVLAAASLLVQYGSNRLFFGLTGGAGEQAAPSGGDGGGDATAASADEVTTTAESDDAGAFDAQDADTTTEAATETQMDASAETTEVAPDAATTVAESAGGGVDPVSVLAEPGAMFFLGGLVGPLALLAVQYRRSGYA